MKLTKILGKVWHFRHLKPSDLQRIVEAGQLRRISANTLIFQETDPSAGMFVLLSGKVHLCKVNPAGKEQIIAVIDPVIMFNELTAIDGGPNPFSAQAVQDCLVWNISHKSFHDLVKRYPDPEIGLGLLKVLAARTRNLINRCDDLSFRPVVSRLAKLLLELSNNGAHLIDRKEYPITKLAALTATVPEVISRSLGNLHEEGFIQCDRSTITILEPSSLTDFPWFAPLDLES